MRIPKRYGKSKEILCPFCEHQSITKNKQGVPVCEKHRNKELPEFTCACGDWLELRTGKFGSYFHCIKCGNISFDKGLELNENVLNKSE